LRGEPLELVARETNVSIARLTEWRERALAGAATALKEREHANSEVVGISCIAVGQSLRGLGAGAPGGASLLRSHRARVARGLKLRHDHGSNYMSGDFQDEIECPGIEASPSFVREPEGNGVAESFIRTLREHLLWVRTFDTIEELRAALVDSGARPVGGSCQIFA
jgi:putative transposase